MRGQRDAQRIRDMLDAIAKIDRWRTSSHRGWPSDMYEAAVLKELAVIGEAATQLSDRYLKRHPALPWKEIKGFRNRVVHQYWDTAWAIVERILEVDLPELRSAIEPDAVPPPKRPKPSAFEEAVRRNPLAPEPFVDRGDICGAWMPRARARCGLRRGHTGHHRKV